MITTSILPFDWEILSLGKTKTKSTTLALLTSENNTATLGNDSFFGHK